MLFVSPLHQYAVTIQSSTTQQGTPVKKVRSVANAIELAKQLQDLEAASAAIKANALNDLNAVLQLVSKYGRVLNDVISELFTGAVADMTDRLAKAASSLSTSSNKATTIRSRILAATSSLQSHLSNSVQAVASSKVSLGGSVAAVGTTITNAVAAATTARATLRSQASASDVRVAALAAVASASTGESNRDATLATWEAGKSASTVTAYSAAASTAMTSEFSSMSKECESTSRTIKIDNTESGSTDFATW